MRSEITQLHCHETIRNINCRNYRNKQRNPDTAGDPMPRRFETFRKRKAAGSEKFNACKSAYRKANSLANSTKSDIIDPNRQEEIPEVRKAQEKADVTLEYLESAMPGHGAVTYEDGYAVKTHLSEIRMSDWLHHMFGGDIRLLNESKEPGDKTPDFCWNGRYWELKGVSTKNSVDRAVREAAKQIGANPGGIILEISASSLTAAAIEETIGHRIRRTSLDLVDVMIVSHEDLEKIVRYKK